MYFIGQEVECIDPSWGSRTGSRIQRVCCPNLPVRGGIYHIRSCKAPDSPNEALNAEAGCWITLVEIVNPILPPHKQEPIFMGKKYRPVWRREQEQDISIFIAILNSAQVREDA